MTQNCEQISNYVPAVASTTIETSQVRSKDAVLKGISLNIPSLKSADWTDEIDSSNEDYSIVLNSVNKNATYHPSFVEAEQRTNGIGRIVSTLLSIAAIQATLSGPALAAESFSTEQSPSVNPTYQTPNSNDFGIDVSPGLQTQSAKPKRLPRSIDAAHVLWMELDSKS